MKNLPRTRSVFSLELSPKPQDHNCRPVSDQGPFMKSCRKHINNRSFVHSKRPGNLWALKTGRKSERQEKMEFLRCWIATISKSLWYNVLGKRIDLDDFEGDVTTTERHSLAANFHEIFIGLRFNGVRVICRGLHFWADMPRLPPLFSVLFIGWSRRAISSFCRDTGCNYLPASSFSHSTKNFTERGIIAILPFVSSGFHLPIFLVALTIFCWRQHWFQCQ